VIDQDAFLAEIVAHLKSSGIPFMISGSFASSFHGKPRATNDLDIVIDPNSAQLKVFLNSLPTGWYASPEAAESAFRLRSMFNIIDTESALKADLILRKHRPFSQEEFRRRIPTQILGTQVDIVTPEDSILSKLEWSLESGSERQFQDAANVATLNAKTLDLSYLKQWARELRIETILQKLLEETAGS
jgi:hypothetical protein